MSFVNRENELSDLEKRYLSERAELFVLYGRRRVGKTELLRAFCEGKQHVFFIATLSSDQEQLAVFSQQVWACNHAEIPAGFTFPTWEAAFRVLLELPGRTIVILDEFTYLISGNKAIPSILQKVWDETLKNSRVFMILCGSYIGMIEKEVLGYRAALYGRRTGSYLLPPLTLPAAAKFFPAYSPIEQLEAWAVLGGMPFYLQTFSDTVDIFANIREHILSTQGTLYNEPQLLLMEELREPRNYFSILRAIAQGRTRLNAISQSAGVGDGRATSRYLDILQRMRLIRRIVSVSEPKPEKSKKGIYQIADSFLRFWYRFVHPDRSSLELGIADAVLEHRVRPTFDQFVSYAFEEAARAHIAHLARSGELPFLPERIGAWWNRAAEIDVVALSDADKAILVGECKWSSRPVGLNILEELKQKSQELTATGHWTRVSYALFAKSGFTPDLQALAVEQGVRLISANEMVAPPHPTTPTT